LQAGKMNMADLAKEQVQSEIHTKIHLPGTIINAKDQMLEMDETTWGIVRDIGRVIYLIQRVRSKTPAAKSFLV
jgi:hypothetical protein